jgi:hypothetical protein
LVAAAQAEPFVSGSAQAEPTGAAALPPPPTLGPGGVPGADEPPPFALLSDPDPAVPIAGPACPFLTESEDALGATLECFAGPQPLSLPFGYEGRYCRGGEHRSCPRWLAANSTRRLAVSARPPAPRAARPSADGAGSPGPRLRRFLVRFAPRAGFGAAAGLAIAAVLLVGRPLLAAGGPPRGAEARRAYWTPQGGPARATPEPAGAAPGSVSPAATATGTPAPGPSLELRVADPRPSPYGEQTVFARLRAGDQPLAGAPCKLDVHYRTQLSTWERRTAADGTVEVAIPLNGVTPLYAIKVEMECTAADRSARATTQFTPGG